MSEPIDLASVSSQDVPVLLSPEDARKLQEQQALFIDIRNAADYAASRIPDAIWIPASEIAARYHDVPAWQSVVLYGDGGEADLSPCIARVFRSHLGFRRIYALAGGLPAWLEAGLPVDASSVELPPQPPHLLRYPWQEIDVIEAHCRQQQGHTLVDIREPMEYVLGHPAGVTHLPMSQIQWRLRDLDAMRPLLLICNSGNRSGMVADWLVRNGFPGDEVANVLGGVIAWQIHRLPWER